LRVRSAALDGDVIVCGEDGVSDVDKAALARVGRRRFLYAVDLLELDGENLRQEQLERRKARLELLLARAGSGLHFVEHVDIDGGTVFEHACHMGLEGIVSSGGIFPYRSGRSKNWIKVKNPASPAMLRLQDGTW
jgi:bifunctional non-homologous end joining protein LigD